MPRSQRYAGSRTPSRTGASRTSFISPSCQNCAAAGTAHKFCKSFTNNTPTRASSSISKSKKIPRTPKNLNAGIVAATFTCATALAPPPSITSGKASTTAYSPQAAPSPTKNSAISGNFEGYSRSEVPVKTYKGTSHNLFSISSIEGIVPSTFSG